MSAESKFLNFFVRALIRKLELVLDIFTLFHHILLVKMADDEQHNEAIETVCFLFFCSSFYRSISSVLVSPRGTQVHPSPIPCNALLCAKTVMSLSRACIRHFFPFSNRSHD